MAASKESGKLNLMFGDKFLMVLQWWGEGERVRQDNWLPQLSCQGEWQRKAILLVINAMDTAKGSSSMSWLGLFFPSVPKK